VVGYVATLAVPPFVDSTFAGRRPGVIAVGGLIVQVV
jgi:hypothetical protein